MGYYDIEQEATDALLQYRRGVAEILNPQEILITIDGGHGNQDKWVKFSGSSYELAEIQINGDYGINATPRPFMYMLYEKIDENRGRYARQIINENMWYDRHERGWYVEWDAICYELENVCIENLMPEVSSELPGLTKRSEKKKADNGYGGEPTLYASHQLVECIHAIVE